MILVTLLLYQNYAINEMIKTYFKDYLLNLKLFIEFMK